MLIKVGSDESPVYCDECRLIVDVGIIVGDHELYKDNVARLCRGCLKKAIDKMGTYDMLKKEFGKLFNKIWDEGRNWEKMV